METLCATGTLVRPWATLLPCLWLALVSGPAPAQNPAATPPAPAAAMAVPGNHQADVVLNHRTIVSLSETLLGRTPGQRVALAQAALAGVLAGDGPGTVTLWKQGETIGVRVDEVIVFYLQPADLNLAPGSGAEQFADAAEAVQRRLQLAVSEVRQRTDPRHLAMGVLKATAAVLGCAATAWAVLLLRRRTFLRMRLCLQHWQGGQGGNALATTFAQHGQTAARGSLTLLVWSILVLVANLGFTLVLGQFSYTRPWAERTTDWGLGLLAQFAAAAAAAVPGLLTAALVFFIAWLVTRANTAFMERVERSDLKLVWLDRDTARPTRRVANAVIWLFSLAMAYPFLPGASSEAFKGVSVLAGLMLSLGASGVVGQIVSGLSLMYSRTLRQGEFVKIGEIEGRVTSVGMFTLKLHTGLSEEVSLPNAVVFSRPVRNYSRLAADGHFVLHTAVTIGYATPWRQVHAMLQEAARRVTGVATDPAPYVIQTALSDFYVEYRLCAQGARSVPRRRAELINQLHAAIQHVFNENGVQIMSPHYRSDPAQAQVVPPEAWSPELAAPAGPARG